MQVFGMCNTVPQNRVTHMSDPNRGRRVSCLGIGSLGINQNAILEVGNYRTSVHYDLHLALGKATIWKQGVHDEHKSVCCT